MKKSLLAVAVLSVLTAGVAHAQNQGPWQVRVRAVHIDSSNGGPAGAAGISLNNKTMPEIDVSYFFSRNVAAELVLTVPQKHDVRLNGAKVGTLKHLPPTLLAQYHFTQWGAFKPYVGAGLNATHFSDVRVNGVRIDSSSWGGALQLGADYQLDKNWSLNLDVKKIYMNTRVTGAGLQQANFKIDPLLVGVGLGYRF